MKYTTVLSELQKNDPFHKILGLMRGYATINYSRPYSRMQRIQMEKRIKNRDVLYLFATTLILVGTFQKIGYSYKVTADRAVQSVQAKAVVKAEEIKAIEYVEVKSDDRAARLEKFLSSKGSPFANLSNLIIQEADEHGIDWTLIASIGGKESSYGKNCPEGSYNAWGIGGAGSMRYFKSWEEGIKYVSALLGNNYKENMLKGIQVKYCPSFECDKNWVAHVASFSDAILATKSGE